MNILSIDAWAEAGGGWTWNQWYKVDEISKEDFAKLDSNRKILKDARQRGLLGENSKGRVTVEDDQYNIVILERNDGCPLFAYAYGEDRE